MTKMSSRSRLPKANGLPPQHPESLSNTLTPTPPTPNATFAQISAIMGSSAQCTSVLPAEKRHPVMQHIIVWRPNVISVVDGDTLTMFATFGSVEDATPRGMWSITAQSIRLPSQMFTTLMEELTLMTMTPTPLWMTTRRMVHIKPGAQVYKGGNVTIFFLSHVFFLVSVVRYPYFRFAPSYKETHHYLLAFPSYSSFIIPL